MSDDKESTENTEGSAEGEGAANVEQENTTTYEPVVQLKEVEVDNGEKNETAIYKQRCILYRFVLPDQWKERGKGDVRFLQNNGNKKVRIVLRQEKTLKLCLNHIVNPKLALQSNPGSDRTWTWRAEDFADPLEPTTDTFAIKFKNSEVANEFKKQYDVCRAINADVLKVTVDDLPNSPIKTEKKAEPKKEETSATAKTTTASSSSSSSSSPSSSATPAKKDEPKKEEEPKKDDAKKDSPGKKKKKKNSKK
jgi:Ran-binding protein 1